MPRRNKRKEAEELKKKIEEAREVVLERGEEIKKKIEASTSKEVEAIKAYTKKHPMKALALAFFIGFLLGRGR